MADMYGSHFEYGGVNSRAYFSDENTTDENTGLIIVNIDTDRKTELSGEREGITFFNKKSQTRYIVGNDYANFPETFPIEIVTDNGRCLTFSERRKVEKWLFNHATYRKLYLDEEDDIFNETYEEVDGKTLRNYLNCRLINPEKIEGNGGIVGYKATLEADSGMYWQDATVKTFAISNDPDSAGTIIDVRVDTDLDEYIYPKVILQVGDTGGTITIANNTDDVNRLTQFENLTANDKIIMNGELNFINDQYYEKFCVRNFIRLRDGMNKLVIQGDVTSITIEYSARRAM